MAETTYNTVLKYGKTADSFTKMCPIKDYPDLGGAPDMLDTTTLDDDQETQIAGIKKAGSMDFTANYDVTTFTALKENEGVPGYFELSFINGEKFHWQGSYYVYPAGSGTNTVKEMKITIARSNQITFEKAGA